MYVSYEEYQKLGGTLEETAFNDLEFESEVVINYLTFNRFKNDSVFPEELKRCIVKLIDICNTKQKAFSLGQAEDGTGGSAIASQSNDGVSISYNTISASEAFALSEQESAKVVKKYLYGVKNQAGREVLYRGYYENE